MNEKKRNRLIDFRDIHGCTRKHRKNIPLLFNELFCDLLINNVL